MIVRIKQRTVSKLSLFVVVACGLMSPAFADEEAPLKSFGGWVLTYCDGDSPSAEIQLEAGACSSDQIYYHSDVSGVRWKALRYGAGRTVSGGDKISVEYTGWLFDKSAEHHRGVQIDSTYTLKRESFRFEVGAGRVITGWDKAVRGMAPGEVREVIISPCMAYGARGAGNTIPPNSSLIFEIELVEIQSD